MNIYFYKFVSNLKDKLLYEVNKETFFGILSNSEEIIVIFVVIVVHFRKLKAICIFYSAGHVSALKI